MLEKRQVLTMVSIAVVSFLIGTMLNFTTIVTGNGESPWDRVWTTISELQSEMETLEDRVETLEGQSIPEGFVNAPAYDSGWTNFGSINQFVVWHGLNTKNVLIYIMANRTEEKVRWYNLTENEIQIYRDTSNLGWEIRVMIWKITEPPT